MKEQMVRLPSLLLRRQNDYSVDIEFSLRFDQL
jgi:hypothetical protein